jgi:protein SCO1/2
MNAFGPEFVGLTGSAAEIREVEKKFRVYAQKQPLESPNGKAAGYGVDHSNVIYLVGPDGKTVSYYTEMIPPDELVKDLKSKI